MAPNFKDTLVPRRRSAVPRLLPRHGGYDRIICTELVKYWRKACILACLNHIAPLQIMAMSLALPSVIVLADDTREKKRPKANSTSTRTKKMSSLSICHYSGTSPAACRGTVATDLAIEILVQQVQRSAYCKRP